MKVQFLYKNFLCWSPFISISLLHFNLKTSALILSGIMCTSFYYYTCKIFPCWVYGWSDHIENFGFWYNFDAIFKTHFWLVWMSAQYHKAKAHWKVKPWDVVTIEKAGKNHQGIHNEWILYSWCNMQVKFVVWRSGGWTSIPEI